MKDIPTVIKNLAAVALGKLGKGKPKHFSKAEIAKRTKRLAAARKLRWKIKAVILLAFFLALAASAQTHVLTYVRTQAGYTFTYGQTIRSMPYDAGTAYIAALARGGWRNDAENGRLLFTVKKPVVVRQAHQPNDLAAVSARFRTMARPIAVSAPAARGMTDGDVRQAVNFANDRHKFWGPYQ